MVTYRTLIADTLCILIGGIIGITLATIWATLQVSNQTKKH